MKKIEKLEETSLYLDWEKKGIENSIRLVKVFTTINEIIEAYNSYFAPDQSQKQPDEYIDIYGNTVIRQKEKPLEGKQKRIIRHELPEGLSKFYTEEAGVWGELIDSLNDEQRSKLLQALPDLDGEPEEVKPEKQEEWREELLDLIDENGRVEDLEDVEFLYVTIRDFISQLLSERTFTKKELEQLRRWYEVYGWDSGEVNDRTIDKVSKLLKTE